MISIAHTPSASSASSASRRVREQRVLVGCARGAHRRDDAAAGARDLFVARAGQPHARIRCARLPRIDEVRVAIDEARRHQRAARRRGAAARRSRRQRGGGADPRDRAVAHDDRGSRIDAAQRVEQSRTARCEVVPDAVGARERAKVMAFTSRRFARRVGRRGSRPRAARAASASRGAALPAPAASSSHQQPCPRRRRAHRCRPACHSPARGMQQRRAPRRAACAARGARAARRDSAPRRVITLKSRRCAAEQRRSRSATSPSNANGCDAACRADGRCAPSRRAQAHAVAVAAA